MNRSILTLILGLALGGATGYGFAAKGMMSGDEHAGHDMGNMDMGPALTGTETPATLAFIAANATMHKDMSIAFSGDADQDFVRGMIPHHQGAVEMAKIVLEHGKDPDVRQLAEGIVAAQESEISWMQSWLAANPQ